jgi:putative addiction module component (TIGR02574 family)
MTVAEELDLIGEIWNCIEPEDISLTEAQAAEIDRRLATLDDDIEQGVDADELEAELIARYRS